MGPSKSKEHNESDEISEFKKREKCRKEAKQKELELLKEQMKQKEFVKQLELEEQKRKLAEHEKTKDMEIERIMIKYMESKPDKNSQNSTNGVHSSSKFPPEFDKNVDTANPKNKLGSLKKNQITDQNMTLINENPSSEKTQDSSTSKKNTDPLQSFICLDNQTASPKSFNPDGNQEIEVASSSSKFQSTITISNRFASKYDSLPNEKFEDRKTLYPVEKLKDGTSSTLNETPPSDAGFELVEKHTKKSLYPLDQLQKDLLNLKSDLKILTDNMIPPKVHASTKNSKQVHYVPRRVENDIIDLKFGKRKSKLKSNVCTYYGPGESERIRRIWKKIEELSLLSDWSDLLKLGDPLLITLKIVECLEDTDIKILDSIVDWESLMLLSEIARYISQCKLEVHKSKIAAEFLYAEFLFQVSEIISSVLHEDFIYENGNDILVTLSGLLVFYKDIIIYFNHIIPENSKNYLIELLKECRSTFLHVSSISTTEMNDKFKEDIDLLLRLLNGKRRRNEPISSESCYPINVLKPNRIEVNPEIGSYSDMNNYLRIHFDLLKEDFERSLRTGIKDYLAGTLKTNENLTIFEQVKLVIRTNASEFRYCIVFNDTKRFRSIHWPTSKYFYFGSLLLLTVDDFRTYYLLKVEDRSDLENGGKELTVSFIFVPPEIDFHRTYLMAEAGAYFDPFGSVLNVLRLKPKFIFPFERYIIQAQYNVSPPAYLNENTVYNFFGRQVNVMDKTTYPTPESVGLNAFQMDSLFNALTNELSLVQGPPGTGKTFMCVKIIEVLLQNKFLWSNTFNTPIVVICYKNLSLDELLDGLRLSKINILRIGSGTKNEELANFWTLRGMDKPKHTWMMNSGFRRIGEQMKFLKNKMSFMLSMDFIMKEQQGLVPFELLSMVLESHHKEFFKHNNYIEWLLDFKKEEEISINCSNDYGLSLKELSQQIFTLEDCVNSLRKDTQSTSSEIEHLILLERTLEYHVQLYEKCYNCLKSLNTQIPHQNVLYYIRKDINTLHLNERWKLYSIWLKLLKPAVDKTISDLTHEQINLKGRLNEMFNLHSAKKISQSNVDVVGLTTTAAARLYKMLNEIKPRIVIIEEAAEVIEGHCLAAINEHCQHLLLFGDHKQLRPLTISNDLGRHYNFGLSLFERLTNNGISPSVLNKQYRMRPEIAALIAPAIYENLENDISVTKFDNVRGMASNIYFLHHQHKEMRTTDSKSCWNQFEVYFLISLAHYLVKQEYQPDEITILAAYGDQERQLLKEAAKYPDLENIIITTIDGYQGKENKIVLLSLVRNNNDGNVGFLTIENRVCVALSRARHGLYILGNMDLLTRKGKLWTEVEKTLKNQNAIGSALSLQCRIHNRVTTANNPKVIEELTLGGCKRDCKKQLECGHKCMSKCHGKDVKHKNIFACPVVCGFTLNCGHTCYLKCHSDDISHKEENPCDSSEGSTELPISDELLHSKINLDKLNIEDDDKNISNESSNTHLCESLFPCGHMCGSHCNSIGNGQHQKHLTCNHKCEQALPCGHIYKYECHSLESEDHSGKFKCQTVCGKQLKCGHVCTFQCHTTDKNHNTVYACKTKCGKTLPCGHACDSDCHLLEDAFHQDIHRCTLVCGKQLSCGHICTLDCHYPTKHNSSTSDILCKNPCGKVKPCGHVCKDPCHPNLPCKDLSSCKMLCNATMKCGHTCHKTCHPLNDPAHVKKYACSACKIIIRW